MRLKERIKAFFAYFKQNHKIEILPSEIEHLKNEHERILNSPCCRRRFRKLVAIDRKVRKLIAMK